MNLQARALLAGWPPGVLPLWDSPLPSHLGHAGLIHAENPHPDSHAAGSCRFLLCCCACVNCKGFPAPKNRTPHPGEEGESLQTTPRLKACSHLGGRAGGTVLSQPPERPRQQRRPENHEQRACVGFFSFKRCYQLTDS